MKKIATIGMMILAVTLITAGSTQAGWLKQAQNMWFTGDVRAEHDVDITGTLKLDGTAVTATAAELNIIDGVTATAAEINALDASGTTAVSVGQTNVTLTVKTMTATIGDITATAGTLITGVGIDGVGAVDLHYGSADITDHTFVTDGTGTAEIVFPAGSIDGTEILDGTIATNDLSTAVQDMIAYITVVGADLASAGTGTITIQVKDANGSDLAGNYLIRTWIGTANDFGVDALTDYSVGTGTSKQEVTANGEYLVITDNTGLAVMAIDNGGAGTVYAWAELGGKVIASGALSLTAP